VRVGLFVAGRLIVCRTWSGRATAACDSAEPLIVLDALTLIVCLALFPLHAPATEAGHLSVLNGNPRHQASSRKTPAHSPIDAAAR
jgi:hypothetical protein